MTTVDKTAAERIAKARAELILARTFYGVLVSQVEPKPSRQFPTMATNGKTHYYNPDFIGTLSQEELLGVQAHETEHDARRHHTRRGPRDPKEWNIACDYAINPDLITEGFKLPSDALINWDYQGMSAEDIYRTRELDRQQEQQKQQPQPQDNDDDADEDEGNDDATGDQGSDDEDDTTDDSDEAGDEAGDDAGDDGEDEGDGQGQGNDGDDEGDDQGEGAGGDEGEADDEGQGDAEGEASGDAEGASEGERQSSGDPGRCGEVLDAADDVAENADQDARWERVLRQAAMLAAKRGDAPGHVSREIARADHPPQDWRETLRAFFDGGAQTIETWSRPNRRFIGGGLYLPGREREGVNRAAFLIDTSGSMMDGVALEAIAVETQAALDEGVIDEVVVIYGDTRVTRVDTYKPGDEIEFDPRGGGGTVLQPLFDHVANEIDASLIVCFTDGFIDITSESPEPDAPVLWAFTGYPQQVREHIANAPWGAAAIDVGSH